MKLGACGKSLQNLVFGLFARPPQRLAWICCEPFQEVSLIPEFVGLLTPQCATTTTHSLWVIENPPQRLNGYHWQIRGIPSGCVTSFRNPDKWLIEA